MKRIIALFLASIILFSVSIVYAAVDYTSMPEAKLKEQYNAIRNALMIKSLAAENETVILDQAGIQIYISDSPTVQNTWSGLSLFIPIIIINNSRKNIAVVLDDISVNGWTIPSLSVTIDNREVLARKKAKSTMTFELEQTDIKTIKDFDDVEFSITIYDKDDWFGANVVPKTKPITIYAKK